MFREPLDTIPLWAFFLATAGLTWLAMEGGYRLGSWRHARAVGEREAPVGAMVGSILGLLAFLLAFTFQMAASRFDARRQAVLEEANAIGTTGLRARLLPEAQRKVVLQLLKEYVDVRIQAVKTGNLTDAIKKSELLQVEVWKEARKASDNKEANAITTGLFVQSLNEMIDMHARRIQVGVRNRIPLIIWTGLFTLAVLAMAAVGYHAGLSATQRSPAMPVMVLAFAGVLYLIADLDRGGEGFLVVSQQALVDLQESIGASAP